VNRSIRNMLSIAVICLLSSASMMAQYNNATRTSVNKTTTTSVNANKSTTVNANKTTNVNVNTTQNVNVNVNKTVQVNSSTSYNSGCCYHPAPVGVAVVGTSTVVVGTRVTVLPASCTVVRVNGFAYSHCGNTWYQPQFVGTSTTYVVVNPPR
jgi:hypothetical protein